jgi:hypothetical protein
VTGVQTCALPILEIGREADDGPFDEFTENILSIYPPVLVNGAEGPSVSYINRYGTELEYNWDGDRRVVDGNVYEFPRDLLFNGPFIRANINDRVIRITDGTSTRTLDFNDLTIGQELSSEEE